MLQVYLYNEGKYLEQSLMRVLCKTISDLTKSNIIFKFLVENQPIYFAENKAFDTLKKGGKNVRLLTELFEHWRKVIASRGFNFENSWYKTPVEYHDAYAVSIYLNGATVDKTIHDVGLFNDSTKEPLKVAFGNLNLKKKGQR